MLAAAESLPIHVMSGPELISASLAQLHPEMRAGDAFLHNSPYHGNSHAGDHCVLVPVVDDEGRHHFTAIVKAHMADIGNSRADHLWANARDVYHEGALIFPGGAGPAGLRRRRRHDRMCRARSARARAVW